MFGELPVESPIDDGLQIFATPVLMIEVVRMLPEVDCEQTRVSSRLRTIRIRGRQDSHLLSAVGYQPKPPAAQVRCTRQRELFGEVREVTECAIERPSQVSARAFLPRRQTLPEKRVIPSV